MRFARVLDAPAPPAPGSPGSPRLRSGGGRIALVLAGVAAVLLLMALGTWQVYRLRWKLDLIAAVDARVHAPAVAAPPPAAWPSVTAEADQYRHVTARGTYDNARETFVQAVTDEGPGFWLLTPFRTDDGFTVLVNRGFVPPGRRDPASRASGEIAGPTRVTGLLRVDEPGGAFLRHNDPASDRWFSRDVGAIAAKRSLAGQVAPYFIDADDAPVPGGFPVGGLTVVAFPNNHLVYTITWYALGLGLAGALVWVVREERGARAPR
ncbi:SURF1 family protein [Lichenibacterium minor]|uniref:SURF1-like protein n=1 Tax=Lichenibacterium minor TaxID=2316528 RepID=A0A4V1RU32_9HYPH|nr:SURF1 family protein [Lichenibacterium minor]RYC29744.1 SURF1 family protein [Lichenibacterium minor]